MKLIEVYDYKATKKEIKKKVNEYKFLKLKINSLSVLHSQDYKIDLVMSSKKNNPTEEYVSFLEDKKSELEIKFNEIVCAYNRLYEEDRKIIWCLLLETERIRTDNEVMMILEYSKDTFFVAKKDAIIRFAIALNIEVLNKNHNYFEGNNVFNRVYGDLAVKN